MFATGNRSLVLMLLAATPVGAQEFTDDDAPAIFQSVPNFYNAVAGRNFKVEWFVEPASISVDSELTLTLKVIGADNPHRIRRPDLATMPSLKSRFRQISAGSDPVPTKGAAVVTFTYKLRPRDEKVTEVPELEYRYYSTASRKLETKYLDKIPLQVTPAAVAPPPVLPIVAPERFFDIPSEASVREEPSANPDWRHWLALLAGVPLAIGAGVAAWRLMNPDGRRLAAVRRNRAVRNALRALDRASKAADPLLHAANAFRAYLVERHGLLTSATAPSEIEASLPSSGMPMEQVVAAAELLRKIDAARFGARGDDAPSLLTQTRELIFRWEGVS